MDSASAPRVLFWGSLLRSEQTFGIKTWKRKFCAIFESDPYKLYHCKTDAEMSTVLTNAKYFPLEGCDVVLTRCSKDGQYVPAVSLVDSHASDKENRASFFVADPMPSADGAAMPISAQSLQELIRMFYDVLNWCTSRSAPSRALSTVGQVQCQGYLLKQFRLKKDELRFYVLSNNFLHFLKFRDGQFRVKYSFTINRVSASSNGFMATFHLSSAGGAGSSSDVGKSKTFVSVCENEETATQWCKAIEAARSYWQSHPKTAFYDFQFYMQAPPQQHQQSHNCGTIGEWTMCVRSSSGKEYSLPILDAQAIRLWSDYAASWLASLPPSPEEDTGQPQTFVLPSYFDSHTNAPPLLTAAAHADFVRGFLCDLAADGRTAGLVLRILELVSLKRCALNSDVQHAAYILDQGMFDIAHDMPDALQALAHAISTDDMPMVTFFLSRQLFAVEDVASLLKTVRSATMLQLLCGASSQLDFTRSPQALWAACKFGDLETVRRLLQAGARADMANPDTQDFPLHAAALEGRTEVAEMLVEKCPGCLNLPDSRQRPAVFVAVRYGQQSFALRFLELYQSQKIPPLAMILGDGGNRASLLHYCAAYSCAKVAKDILDRRLLGLDVVDIKGMSCLDVCLDTRNEETFKVVVDHYVQTSQPLPGAVFQRLCQWQQGPPSFLDHFMQKMFQQSGAVHLWTQGCHVRLLRALQHAVSQDAQFEVPAQSLFLLLSDPNSFNDRLQQIEECVNFAVQYLDPDTVAADSATKQTAMHMAASYNLINVLRILLEAGANPNLLDASGQAPLHIAARLGHRDCLGVLCQHFKTDINLPDRQGDTALDVLIATGDERSCDLLLQSGAYVFLPRMLQRAVQLTTAAVMTMSQLLCDYSSGYLGDHTDVVIRFTENINAPPSLAQMITAYASAGTSRSGYFDANGQTPLHTAVVQNDAALLQKTLSLPDVYVDLKNTDGSTALHLAARSHNLTMCQLLVEKGCASIYAVDRKGRTPLHLLLLDPSTQGGARGCDPKLLDFFLDRGARVLSFDVDRQCPLGVNPPALLDKISSSELCSLTWQRLKYVVLRNITAMQQQQQQQKQSTSLESTLETMYMKGCTNSTVSRMRSGTVASPSTRKKKFAWEVDPGDIQLQKELGRGGFGVVYQGQFHGTCVAVKKILGGGSMDAWSLDSFRSEVAILSELRHPNIVLFMGASLDDPKNLCFVTEFCGKGSLFDVLHSPSAGQMQLSMRLKMATDIARGMAYLHFADPPIVHQDLKSMNILVSESNVCKVADFGLSAKKASYRSIPSNGGTMFYSAPEVLSNGEVSEAADVYAYAIILWELLTLDYPFADFVTSGKGPDEFVRWVVQNNYRPTIPDQLTRSVPDVVRLVKQCWHSNPAVRPRFPAILDSLQKVHLPPTTTP